MGLELMGGNDKAIDGAYDLPLTSEAGMGIFPHQMGVACQQTVDPGPDGVLLLDQPVRVMGMEALDAAWRGCAAHPLLDEHPVHAR
jgi:hypothetical protein